MPSNALCSLDLLEHCARDRPRQRLEGGGVVLQGVQRLPAQPGQLRRGDAATALLLLLGLAGDDDLVEERSRERGPGPREPRARATTPCSSIGLARQLGILAHARAPLRRLVRDSRDRESL